MLSVPLHTTVQQACSICPLSMHQAYKCLQMRTLCILAFQRMQGIQPGVLHTGMSEGGWHKSASEKGNDGLRSEYRKFTRMCTQLTPATAPDLFEYLGPETEEDQSQAGKECNVVV